MKLGSKRLEKKKLLYVVAGLIVVILAVKAAIFFLGESQRDSEISIVGPPRGKVDQSKSATQSISFAAMGDMLAHDSVVNQAKTSDGYDFVPYFDKIKSLYDGSDVVFCNPETPAAGERFGIWGYPALNAPTEFSRDLSKAGCNMTLITLPTRVSQR